MMMGADTALGDSAPFGPWGWAFAALLLAITLAAIPIVRRLRQARIERTQLHYLAHHDELTGLHNRAWARQQLAVLTREAPESPTLAVLSIDIDGFTLLSDAMGRDVADALLRQAAERLRVHLGEKDVAARLDKDDFVILRVDTQAIDVQNLAQRLIQSLSEPYRIAGQPVTVGVNIGIAMFPRDGDTFDILCKNADSAVHELRRQSVNNYRFFKPAMDTDVRRRLMLAHDLRDALGGGQLALHYQPIVDVSTGRVRGLEALLRWVHPTHGMVSPVEFVPLAERTGLIVAIGEWVLETACREVARLPSDIELSVNISPRQFQHSDLPGTVAKVLARTGMPAERLCLEVTEGLLIRDGERMVTMLASLRQQGVRVALDDFGSGYANLGYLRRFVFDKIKIDRAFIQDIARDPEAQALSATMIGLAHRLGMQVVAEGVETEAQRQRLTSDGCDLAQGYLFSPAMPAADLAHLPVQFSSHTQENMAERVA